MFKVFKVSSLGLRMMFLFLGNRVSGYIYVWETKPKLPKFLDFQNVLLECVSWVFSTFENWLPKREAYQAPLLRKELIFSSWPWGKLHFGSSSFPWGKLHFGSSLDSSASSTEETELLPSSLSCAFKQCQFCLGGLALELPLPRSNSLWVITLMQHEFSSPASHFTVHFHFHIQSTATCDFSASLT